MRPALLALFLVACASPAPGPDAGSDVGLAASRDAAVTDAAPADAAPAQDVGAPGLDAAASRPDAAGPFDASVDAGPVVEVMVGATALGPANRRLLGYGIQWPDDADHLVDPKTGLALAPKLAALGSLGVPLLRFPGGTLADGFSFQNSIQPIATRPEGVDLSNAAKPMALGAGEFLEMCRQLGAEPLFGLNLFGAGTDGVSPAAAWTSADSIAWVQWVASEAPKHSWPKPRCWEIGNEPYLDTAIPLYGPDVLSPAVYVQRANEVIRALRAIDSTLKLAVPFRLDDVNGIATTAADKDGYEDLVLKSIEPFDLAAVHDGYLPIDFSDKASDADLYLATMAGPLALEEVLETHRAKLDAARPGNSIRFAMTEYHPWLRLETLIVLSKPGWTQQELLDALDRDHCASSVAGALYTADVVRLMAYRGDFELATFWSVAGNYVFGALNDKGDVRPPGMALQAAGEVLRGELVPVQVNSPALFATPSVGLVRAFAAVPALTAMAAREGRAVRLLLMHKHPSDPVRVAFPGLTIDPASARVLTSADPLAHDDSKAWLAWQSLPVVDGRIDVPPHALVRLDATAP